jgi:hypothetical protein
MDKRGTDKMLSIYWFVILLITAAAIVYMVALFYGKPYDIREIEANLLATKVSDCLVQDNYLRLDISDENFKTNFLEACKLNFNVEDSYGGANDQYFIRIEPFGIIAGNSNLESSCSNKLDDNPFCIQRSFYALTHDNQNYTVKILSVIRKTEKNFK